METITEDGKKHPVFSRFGTQVNIIHVNQLHCNFDTNKIDFGEVLALNAANEPSALSINLSYLGQATTWQAHPEFTMKIRNINNNSREEFLAITKDITATIPKGLSLAYKGMVAYAASKTNAFNKKYKFGLADIENLLNYKRLAYNLGTRFYGPVLAKMTDDRMRE